MAYEDLGTVRPSIFIFPYTHKGQADEHEDTQDDMEGAQAKGEPAALGKEKRRRQVRNTDKPILDACCGSRMFWKDHHNPQVLYCDNRILKCQAIWKSTNGKSTRYCTVEPDIVADFTALPFPDASFVHVVFDPPHLVNVGATSWMAKKYGKLDRYEWPKTIKRGFDECWRVLKPNGTLVFKWGQRDISVERVLEVIGREPLYGHITGKGHNTLWDVYVKLEGGAK